MLGLVSCENRGQLEQGTGYLDLRVSRDVNVDIVPVVKSSSEDVISVTITPENGGEPIYIEDINQIEEPIKLKTGDYKAVATSGEDKGSAAFDAPYYFGQTEFTVRNMQMVTKEIVCTLASAKVTASFSSAFAAAFDYRLTVSNGVASLEFSEEAGTLGKEAYFHVTDQLSWTLEVTNTKGETFSLDDTYTEVAARQHYALSFDLEKVENDAFGASEFSIVVDNSLTVKEYDMPIIIYPDIPIIVGAENVSFASGNIPSDSYYTIVSTKKYKSVVISHNDDLLASMGIPTSIELCGAAEQDIQALKSAGVGVSYDANGVDTGLLTEETTDVELDMTELFAKLPIGKYSISMTALNELDLTSSFTANVEVVSPVEVTSVVAWANFAVIKGKYHTSELPAGFAIQHKSSDDWTDGYVLLQDVDQSAKTFKTMICKLAAGTSYSFRILTTKDGALDDVRTVMTEGVETIPNLNFDLWSNGDVVYPYEGGKNNRIWDTANEGLSMGGINTTTEETANVVKGSAVKMVSKKATILIITKFAAGNIYTGDFVNVDVGSQGALLDWGIKFTGRPVAMKGYYKYAPKAIDNYDSSHSGLKGQMDKCQIQVALADGTTHSKNNSNYYFYIDTGNNGFVDFSDKNKTLIAYNKLESSESLTEYKAFTLPFGYRRVDTIPTYIMVTCCSSYLGDYFTGGDGSTLWADEFEFIYDPSDPAMTDQQRREFFNLF